MSLQILGLIAGALTVGASLPQILKIARSKKTDELSLPAYIILNIGIFIWILYGFLTNQIALIIPNIIFQIFNLIILFFKIKYG